MIKQIGIKEEIYNNLVELKGEKSFSDIIEKLIKISKTKKDEILDVKISYIKNGKNMEIKLDGEITDKFIPEFMKENEPKILSPMDQLEIIKKNVRGKNPFQ